MPFFGEVLALPRAGAVYAAFVVCGQETAGAAGLFDQAQLGAVCSEDGIAFNKIILVHFQCGGKRGDVSLCE